MCRPLSSKVGQVLFDKVLFDLTGQALEAGDQSVELGVRHDRVFPLNLAGADVADGPHLSLRQTPVSGRQPRSRGCRRGMVASGSRRVAV